MKIRDGLPHQNSWNHLEKPSNRLRIIFFAALLVITLSQGALSLASIPLYYERVVTRTLPESTNLSNESVAAEAAVRGMDLSTYARYTITLNLITTLVFVGVGFLILSKAQGDWFRWFTVFILVFVPNGRLFTFAEAAQLGYPFTGIGAILWPFFLLYFYIFPNGKPAPRWTKWPMAIIIGLHFFLQLGFFLQHADVISPAFTEIGGTIGNLVLLTGFPLILFSQVYRYFRVSNLVERAQTLWVVSGLAVIVFSIMIVPLLTGAFDVLNDIGFLGDINSLLLLLIPITIAISVLRYRLFEIDVIIRKTLVYTVLTASLGTIYFGTVVLLQSLVGQSTNEQSPLVIVLSTLLIAALFSPLRHRIQSFIDRRFFRRKYDAAQTLAGFAHTARDEVDMDRLSAALIEVVQDTMQPDNLSLWLSKS
jgi:hypothetical protein